MGIRVIWLAKEREQGRIIGKKIEALHSKIFSGEVVMPLIYSYLDPIIQHDPEPGDVMPDADKDKERRFF
jgi:hypothetical protein